MTQGLYIFVTLASLLISVISLFIAWRVLKATEAIVHTLRGLNNIMKDKIVGDDES